VLSSILRAMGIKREEVPRSVEEKLDFALKILNEIRDELKPLGPDGERISRLELILAGIAKLSPEEREQVRQELEALEVDEQILKIVEKPKTIEEIAKKIGRSYGYTAARLRMLMKQGRVMRKRDAVTRKYVYVRV